MSDDRLLRVARTATKLAAMRHPLVRAVAVLALAAACAAAAAEERVIQYADDFLTVRVTKAPLGEVLDEILRQAGAELHGQPRNSGDVTVAFERVPLAEGLHRLLGEQNFMLVYAGNDQLRTVRLLGGPLAPQAPGAGSPAAGPPVRPKTTPTELTSMVAGHGPVPVSGHLQQVVGNSTAGLPQLVQLALHHDDPTVRSEAMRTVMSTLEADPALRTAIVEQLNATDDAQLSAMLRGAAGDRAEEVAMQVLTQARAAEIRTRASSVLQKLRAGS
jgi:hypothetical protein